MGGGAAGFPFVGIAKPQCPGGNVVPFEGDAIHGSMLRRLTRLSENPPDGKAPCVVRHAAMDQHRPWGVARADPARLRQAVIALVDNARRHADPCVVRIEVAFDEATATIRVVDDGPGLGAGFENRAFDPFARGARRANGSGLGLAVVRAIARAHGGDAGYARDGARPIFRITLPRPPA